MRLRGKQITIGVILDWLQALFALLAGVALILDTFDIWSLPVFEANLSKITFLLICGLILSSFLERRFILQRMEETISDKYGLGQRMLLLGVAQVYQDRRDLPRMDEYLCMGTSNILIAGISLYGLITNNRDLFERKIASGCFIRFLLPEALPADEMAIAHLADEVSIQQTRYDLERTFKEIADLAKKTTPTRGKPRVEVRVFNFIPTMGVIMLDAHKRSGNIRVEMYPYASPVDRRPALELQPSQKDDCLYDYIRARYEELWKKSHVYKIN